MVKTLVLTLSLLAIVGLVFVSADEKVKVTRDAITGKIIAVEMDKKAITLHNATTGKDVVYIFNDSTKFYRDGKVVEVKTITTDDEVTVHLSPDEENLILRLDTPVVVLEEDKD